MARSGLLASRRVAALLIGLALASAATARAGGPEAPAKDAAQPPVKSTPDATSEACRARAIRAVQTRYEGIRDLRARFAQTTRPAALEGRGSAETSSRGSVVVAKPSRMRWTYESPEPSVVVSDGKTLWIYDPSFAEVQRLPVDGGFLSGAALQFLLGRGDMQREFDVRLVSCAATAVELELIPRQPTSYEKLRIVADPRTGDVSRTQIQDLLGNVTIVAFSEIEVNQDPPASVFHFDPPEGVRVMDLAAPKP